MALPSAQFVLKEEIGGPINRSRLVEQSLVLMLPSLAKFTHQEWILSNNQRRRIAEDQMQLAQRVMLESHRVTEEAKERTDTARLASELGMQLRIEEVEFSQNELNLQRKETCDEIEALGLYKVRIQDSIASIEFNTLDICRKCLSLREGRLGIDLVADNVDAALQNEISVVLHGRNILVKTLEQVHEQMRRIRSTRYMIDQDLLYKQDAIDIDKKNLMLNHNNTSLSIYEGFTQLDNALVSADEYNTLVAENIKNAAREINSARFLRAQVDTLMKQVMYDMRVVCSATNFAFNEKIKETSTLKAKLEDMHKVTTTEICKMQDNILNLKLALAEKEGHIGLAHTRLGQRALRKDYELVRDSGNQALLYECASLRKSVEDLQVMLHEANASLRYLLQTQMQLEEDINIKINTLKIDEVDCMTIRQTINYNDY